MTELKKYWPMGVFVVLLWLNNNHINFCGLRESMRAFGLYFCTNKPWNLSAKITDNVSTLLQYAKKFLHGKMLKSNSILATKHFSWQKYAVLSTNNCHFLGLLSLTMHAIWVGIIIVKTAITLTKKVRSKIKTSLLLLGNSISLHTYSVTVVVCTSCIEFIHFNILHRSYEQVWKQCASYLCSNARRETRHVNLLWNSNFLIL